MKRTLASRQMPRSTAVGPAPVFSERAMAMTATMDPVLHAGRTKALPMRFAPVGPTAENLALFTLQQGESPTVGPHREACYFSREKRLTTGYATLRMLAQAWENLETVCEPGVERGSPGETKTG